MLKRTTIKLVTAVVLAMVCIAVHAQQLAFPGAQGWGRFATGGRTGTVYHVTNLNDSGSGSLRDAVSQPNRIVVFDVVGVINIKSRIVFSNNLYVAGQTAPGEGVTVYGDGVSFTGASNIIVRYMRFRMGHNGSSGKDAAGLANGANMIFDHCSFSWGLDETFSINPDGKGTTPQNITLQHSIVGQGLLTHSAGGLMQANYISIIGNLLIDNSTRNFKIKGINQYANNMVYNWKNGAYIMGGDSEGTSYCNIQSNLFINGPAVGGDAFTGGNADFHCYAVDNWQDSNRDGVFNPSAVTKFSGATVEATAYDYPELTLNPGQTLLQTNLPMVGASLPYRDPADCYMVDEIMSYGKQGALISNEETLVCGAPSTWTVYAGTKKTDTDGDGMPDTWETANGTNPNSNDAMTIATNGYANIENYINSITVDDRDYFLRIPVALTLDKATTTTLTVSWRDYTYAEKGFAIEVNGSEVVRTAANATSYTISGLTPGTKYTVRLRAFDGSNYSGYTAETAMSTRPLEADVVDIDGYEADYTWTGGTFDYNAAANSNVLLAPSSATTLTLAQTIEPKAVVYNVPASLTVSGQAIGGATSVNKAGAGTLTLTGSNTYTGATVLHEGVLELSSLKNGGEPSAIGSSVEFAQNWIADGGTYRYTGGNTTTNRSMKLSSTSTFDIQSGTVTMNGTIEGSDASADFLIDGNGQLTVGTTNFFGYNGATILKGGTLYLSTTDIAKKGIGSSSKLIMAGGHLKTKGESNNYETYSFPIEVVEETVSQFSPNRNCYINNKVSGLGTIQLNIPYLREYVQGDWSEFRGRLIANGVSTDSRGSLLLLDKSPKMNNTIIELQGNANLCYWSTTGNLTIGGLSGTSGTYLNGSSKDTNGFTCTWTVGSANSDETFAGRINNWSASGSGHTGTVSINKIGTGLWRLTGTNDYKGTTTVSAGTLIVNGKNNGTGSVAVAADATLGGKGTIAGLVTINNGGTLMVGDEGSSDSGLKLTGGLTLKTGAILRLNDAMMNRSFSYGNEIQAFTGTATGTFAEIIPATPGNGLKWDTSELYTSGKLKVIGENDNPGEDVLPTVPTYSALLTWDNMTLGTKNGYSTLTGNSGSAAEGFSMSLTGNSTKTYGSSETITAGGVTATTIKLSNGAENTLYLPAGYEATSMTIWSYTNPNKDRLDNPYTSYWKSVAGISYTESTAYILQRFKDTSNPDHVTFELDNLTECAFANAGEQQCIVIAIEYEAARTHLDETSVTVPASAASANVLVKRMLRAGEWSTIVLPFAMNKAQVKDAYGNDVHVADFTGCTASGDARVVNFQTVESMEANHPYIIKVTKNVSSFKVNSVSIEPVTTPTVTCSGGSFIGTYVADTTIPAGSVFLSDNKFWNATASTLKSKAYRGYFTLDGAPASRILLSVDGTTGLNDVVRQAGESASAYIYNLNGQRTSQPMKGVYIVNGKKIIK